MWQRKIRITTTWCGFFYLGCFPLRTLGLVVSIAGASAVDAGASHSSIEMRAALARESARLFQLNNFEAKQRHIVVTGKHGTYSIHLGSGIASKNGLQLGIIPAHGQHWGQIFLPLRG